MSARFGHFLNDRFERRDSMKASIAQKYFLNEKSDEVYSHYLQTEMQTIHPDLQNFEGIFFSEGMGSIFNRVEKYNENWSGSIA